MMYRTATLGLGKSMVCTYTSFDVFEKQRIHTLRMQTRPLYLLPAPSF